MNRLITLFALTSLTVSAMAYDQTKAQDLNVFYSHMTQKACAESKLLVNAEDVMKMLRDKKDFLLLDVRTKGETSVISLSTENSLSIPLEKLFDEKSLKQLPSDKPIVIVCHSGARAMMAAMGLKQIGFKNIQLLKGGIMSLAVANSVENAPIK